MSKDSNFPWYSKFQNFMVDFLACLCRGRVTKGVQALNYRSRGGTAAVEPSPLREHGALEQNRLPPPREGEKRRRGKRWGAAGGPAPSEPRSRASGGRLSPGGDGDGKERVLSTKLFCECHPGDENWTSAAARGGSWEDGGAKAGLSVLGDVEEEALKLPKPPLELGPSSERGYKWVGNTEMSGVCAVAIISIANIKILI